MSRDYVDNSETIKGIFKPNFTTLFLEYIFNKFFILILFISVESFALLAGVNTIFKNSHINMISFIPIVFYLLYMGYGLLSYHFTEYVITNKMLYKKSGIIREIVVAKPFNEISHITIQRGLADRIVGTGDVIINNGPYKNTKKYYDGDNCDGLVLTDVSEFEKVFAFIKKQQNINNNF